MDLTTTYMGLKLKNPLVASASPLSADVGNIRRLEDAGAAAVVLFSLFEEQIRRDNDTFEYLMDRGSDSYAESLSYFPDLVDYQMGPVGYLELIRCAREVVDIPIIASLNGITREGWVDYARQMQEAGAQGIELNVYYIPAALEDGREVEDRYLEILGRVKAAVSVPVAVKLSPFFSSIGHMARQLADGGADGLVLFNRFYQPDFNLDTLEVERNLALSEPSEIRLPLLWIALLYGRIDTSLAASRGVHDAREVVKYLLAGADAMMTTSALLRNGVGHMNALVDGLSRWMEEREFASVSDMKGTLAQLNVADPGAFERANYIKILESWQQDHMA